MGGAGGMALTGTEARWRNQAPRSPSATNFSNHIRDNQKETCFNSLLLSVPSLSEVQFAISSLQRYYGSLMQGIPTSELSWDHPVLSPTLTLSPGFQRFKDTLLLLQTNLSIKRLVLSLSSDESVWNAVLQNKFLRQLKESLTQACLEGSPDHNKEPDPFACIGRWILELMKAKVVELVDKFKSLVDDIFESAPQKVRMTAESRECLEEKLKSSVLLSIIILLIVVVTRASHLP